MENVEEHVLVELALFVDKVASKMERKSKQGDNLDGNLTPKVTTCTGLGMGLQHCAVLLAQK